MKYEISKKKRILAVFIVVVLVLCFGLFMKNKTNTLNNSSINKESVTKELNNNLIRAYIQEGEEYIQTDNIPSSGYEFNEEKSYCKIGDIVQEDTTLSYDMNTQTITVSPITKEGLKCYLYFDEKASGSEYILANPNAPTNHTTDWTGKESYYYTGNPDNWVQFAGFYWRIIRINGDGSIRMIYQGTSANKTGPGTEIGTKAFNSLYNNNMYVGFKYGSDSSDYNTTHANVNNSTILGPDDSNDKTTLNGWYRANLLEYTSYLDGNAGFCGDRTPSTSSSSVDSKGGTGTTQTYYGAYIRLYFKRVSNSNPSLQCNSQDVYTTTDSSSGNKSLQYPIGLVTADEVGLTGITWNDVNIESYLYTGRHYWTMTPSCFNSSFNMSYVFRVNYDGSLYDYIVDNSFGVRPVINLKADVQITGSGTVSDPFKVVGAS